MLEIQLCTQKDADPAEKTKKSKLMTPTGQCWMRRRVGGIEGMGKMSAQITCVSAAFGKVYAIQRAHFQINLRVARSDHQLRKNECVNATTWVTFGIRIVNGGYLITRFSYLHAQLDTEFYI